MHNQSSQYIGRDLEAMSFAKNYHLWILHTFKPFIGNHLVEVGAGIGDFSQLLLTTNPTSFVAIEPSRGMYHTLKDNLNSKQNVTVFNQFFNDVSLPQKPDTIFYINVLEHIEDDTAELHHIYQCLQTGGHVCIFVPALPRLYGSVDKAVGHFRRYEKQSLQLLMQQIGFEEVKCHYFDIMGILPWWLFFCVFKLHLKANQVSLYDKLVVPIMQRVERIIIPPIGKNLLMVAKKG
ncbi:MAG: methyltransferase domain-containing protein [Thiomargarita sp.]|nr:methyltransferase domain-containing protein [Thiomargarita sp.]